MAAARPDAAIRLWPQPWPRFGSASYSASTATVGPGPLPALRRPERRLHPAERLLDLEALPRAARPPAVARRSAPDSRSPAACDLIGDTDDPRPVLVNRPGNPAAQLFTPLIASMPPAAASNGVSPDLALSSQRAKGMRDQVEGRTRPVSSLVTHYGHRPIEAPFERLLAHRDGYIAACALEDAAQHIGRATQAVGDASGKSTVTSRPRLVHVASAHSAGRSRSRAGGRGRNGAFRWPPRRGR